MFSLDLSLKIRRVDILKSLIAEGMGTTRRNIEIRPAQPKIASVT